jgi:EAL domain-containing protein (putative c-di-GMP-specific phosphodiesterase class I)/ActR/RegA family two-component response regulator
MNLKTLVVDDRPSVCQALSRMLAALHVRWAESACSGAEALERIERAEERFDVAIFDLNMPGDDGLICLRRLAQLPEPPAVILISGADAPVLDAARRLGENLGLVVLGTLAKPVDRARLGALLESAGRVSGAAPADAGPVLDEAEIRRALAERRFEMWFQPQLHIASGQIRGVEALLRLRDRDRGLLGPDAFLKVAEQHDLLPVLTDFAVDTAIARLRDWQNAGCHVTVSINLSRAGLRDLSLPDRAELVCRAHGLNPSQLVIELTESSLASDTNALLDIISRLRLKGFRLSLDDFGKGYASLEDLRSLPFHELKLDKQFVQAAGHSSRARAIVESSIGLAAELRMTTVAEGVENDETLQLVSRLGCQMAQGFYIGRPMPASELSGWIRQRDTARRQVQEIATWDHTTSSHPAPSASAIGGSEAAVLKLAHNLASPLMMVLAISDLMLEEDGLTEKQRADLQLVKASAEEAGAILKALQSEVRGAAG